MATGSCGPLRGNAPRTADAVDFLLLNASNLPDKAVYPYAFVQVSPWRATSVSRSYASILCDSTTTDPPSPDQAHRRTGAHDWLALAAGGFGRGIGLSAAALGRSVQVLSACRGHPRAGGRDSPG